jgi:hypothetical protein
VDFRRLRYPAPGAGRRPGMRRAVLLSQDPTAAAPPR